MELVTALRLWELALHLLKWTTNLRRAGPGRKRQSKKALRMVVNASRKTRAYMRKMRDTGKNDYDIESDLSGIWTSLGFELKDLGLKSLAKRCDIKGRYWSDPTQFDEAFLDKADIGLERIELLAQQLLAEIDR